MNPISFEGELVTERARRNLLILDSLRRSGPLSKGEISRLVGVNVVSISNYISDFIKENLILEKEFDVSQGGRRPLLLALNPDHSLTIGIGINLFNIVGVVANIDGEIRHSCRIDKKSANAEEVIPAIIKVIRRLLEDAEVEKNKIKGIGIGIAGIIDKSSGRVRWPEKIEEGNYNYSSVSVPLTEIINKEFGLEVFLENDSTLACFGEQWLSLSPSIKNILYMFSGVGCGIMVNGYIYSGARGIAGETAIYNPREDDMFNCEWGNPCFLKRWEADLGIKAELKSLIEKSQENPHKEISEIKEIAKDINNISFQEIVQLSNKGFVSVESILKKAAKRLGIKIAYFLNLMNPELVIIGGGIEELGGQFIDIVRATVSDWVFEEVFSSAKIVPSRLGDNAVALGAASLVTRESFIHM